MARAGSRPPSELIAEVTRLFREKKNKRRTWFERYGYGRVPSCAKSDGKWWVTAAGGIYKQVQEGGYNFANFLHDWGLSFFGVPFLETEEAKPLSHRHPALQWMYTFVERDARLRAEGNTDPRAQQTGSGAAWLRFGYDLFTIGDNARLEARLRNRLLDPLTFQAARYELRVAALCITAGLELQFEDEEDNSQRHPEFVASDRFSPARIIVEVKSRHRRGVQGFQGGLDIQPGERVDIRRPILEAYTKASTLPLYVFVDANLPPTPDAHAWANWMHQIDTTMADLSAEGYADPCPANIVLVINDCSHYLLSEQIGNDRDRIWLKHYTAVSPRLPHPDGIKERLLRAHDQRMVPPADFPDFQ
jgi:hypothetical protein